MPAPVCPTDLLNTHARSRIPREFKRLRDLPISQICTAPQFQRSNRYDLRTGPQNLFSQLLYSTALPRLCSRLYTLNYTCSQLDTLSYTYARLYTLCYIYSQLYTLNYTYSQLATVSTIQHVRTPHRAKESVLPAITFRRCNCRKQFNCAQSTTPATQSHG